MQDLLNASKSENLMINNSKRNSFLLTSLELTNTDIIPDDLATNESPINRYNDKSELQGTQKSQQEFKLSPMRWPMQIFFTMALVSNGFLMVGFSPVASILAEIYNCEKIIVDLQCLLFLICFIPGNFVVIKILD